MLLAISVMVMTIINISGIIITVIIIIPTGEHIRPPTTRMCLL